MHGFAFVILEDSLGSDVMHVTIYLSILTSWHIDPHNALNYPLISHIRYVSNQTITAPCDVMWSDTDNRSFHSADS